MTLPPLPEPAIGPSQITGYKSPMFDALYTKDQVKAYGLQCRAQALQEAADLCNSEQWHDTQTKSVKFIKAWNEACVDCAEAIRRLV